MRRVLVTILLMMLATVNITTASASDGSIGNSFIREMRYGRTWTTDGIWHTKLGYFSLNHLPLKTKVPAQWNVKPTQLIHLRDNVEQFERGQVDALYGYDAF